MSLRPQEHIYPISIWLSKRTRLSHPSFLINKQVDLYIERLPRLPREHNYKCIFDKKEQTTASSMSFGLSCPLPKVMHRPKIQPGRGKLSIIFLLNELISPDARFPPVRPANLRNVLSTRNNADHAIVELAVRSSETNTDFLSGKITFFECQLHTT